ncbi:patatin-like phospholipase family protein [Zoogloea sp.]|uniref:patatin-like phospholipase family protein n=1 Tax=Zoogloea sp. TaxID=49181 RepID=UPI0035B20BA1
MAVFDLVFEGSGVKGFAFFGALQAFRAAGHTHRRLLGVSAGAISATLLAAGYSPDEMLEISCEKLPDGNARFSTFMDVPTPADFTEAQIDQSDSMRMLRMLDIPLMPTWLEEKLVKGFLKMPPYRQLFSFVECGGLFVGDAFLSWMSEKLKSKGFDNCTLASFHQKTGVDLTLLSSDTDTNQMRFLNFRTAPDLPLVWAVRMSMSIPFVWREVVWQKEWGLYLKQDLTGNRFVDGGLLSNFPISLLVEQPKPNSFAEHVMGAVPAGEVGTIGLLVNEKIAIPGQSERGSNVLGELQVLQRVGRLVDTMTEVRDSAQIKLYASKVCHLPARGYGTTDFGLSEERFKVLVEAARRAMEAYLKTV